MHLLDLRTYEGRELKKGKELGYDIAPDCNIDMELRADQEVEVLFVDLEGVVLPWDVGRYLHVRTRVVGAARCVIRAKADCLLAYRGSFLPVTSGEQDNFEPVEVVLAEDKPSMIVPEEMRQWLMERMRLAGFDEQDANDLLDDSVGWDEEEDQEELTPYQEPLFVPEPLPDPVMPVNAPPEPVEPDEQETAAATAPPGGGSKRPPKATPIAST